MTDLFRLRLLGPVQAERRGEALQDFKSRKALALLCYLVTQDQPVSRSYLVDFFWPDKNEVRGRNNLSQVLHNIEMLWPGCLESDRYTVQFRQAPSTWLDVRVFNDLVARGEPTSLATAVDLYRGDFMAGMYLDDCPEFEQWLRLEQETWRQRVSQVLQNLIAHHISRNEVEPALQFVTRLLTIDRGQEEAHRCKMLLLARQKQRGAALAQYEFCRDILQNELGVDPEPETVALYEQIKTGDGGLEGPGVAHHEKFSAPYLPLETPSASFNNLPAQTTSFIGRENELATISQSLANPGCRLLTIVGLGGSGKTRLALQAAATAVGQFRHGVCFVPLAPVSSTEFLISTFADALKFPLYGHGDPKEQLLNYLGEKEMLLVIDNFEHLLAGVNLLAEILQRAPQVKILATSRERLKLAEEWALDLQGLPIPTGDDHQEIENYGAVRLFLERAQQARAGTHLADLDMPAVARICQLVEGLPLGIELAATWTRSFSCRGIAAEIERNYNFLTSSLRNVPQRHQSLQAVFEHSWELLTQEERIVFRKLSVFRGSFSLEAARQVAGASLFLLSTLVDKSLVRWVAADRYDVHQLLRQYGAEKLAEMAGQSATVHVLHCQYYATFLGEQECRLRGKKQKEALEAINLEIDNVRAGWYWAIANRYEEGIQQYLEVLFLFHNMQSWFREGETLFRQAALSLPARPSGKAEANSRGDSIRSQVLVRQGVFCASLGHYEQARAILQEGLAILQDPSLRQARPLTLNYLGAIAWALGDYNQARQLCQEALTIIRAIGDRWKEALTTEYLGMIALSLGEYVEARDLAQKSLAIFKEFGYSSGIAFCLSLLGIAARNLGQYAKARQVCQESLIVAREIGDHWSEALALEYLSMTAISMGEYLEARHLAQRSLAIFKKLSYSSGIAFCLNLLGVAARNLGQYAEAARLHQDVLRTCQDTNYQLGIALASYYLGHTNYLLGEHQEAQRLLTESLAISKKLAYQRGITRSLNTLGNVACALGHFHEAEIYLRKALELTQKIHAVPMALDVLTGLADLFRQEGKAEPALELLTLPLSHAASEKETRDKADRLLAEMAAVLPDPAVETVRVRAKTQKLDEVIARVLQWKTGDGRAMAYY